MFTWFYTIIKAYKLHLTWVNFIECKWYLSEKQKALRQIHIHFHLSASGIIWNSLQIMPEILSPSTSGIIWREFNALKLSPPWFWILLFYFNFSTMAVLVHSKCTVKKNFKFPLFVEKFTQLIFEVKYKSKHTSQFCSFLISIYLQRSFIHSPQIYWIHITWHAKMNKKDNDPGSCSLQSLRGKWM